MGVTEMFEVNQKIMEIWRDQLKEKSTFESESLFQTFIVRFPKNGATVLFP